MIAFINDHREAYGIEPICKVLPIALSTYHAHIAQRIDPSKRSARAQRDEALKIEVRRVFEENFRVYGARKVWRQLRREGFTIARCTVERLKPLSCEDVPARQHFELAYVRNGNCKLQRRPQRQAARPGVRGLGAIRSTGFMRATSVRGRCTRLVACMTMTTGGTRPSC